MGIRIFTCWSQGSLHPGGRSHLFHIMTKGFLLGIFSVGRWSPFWFLHILARLFSRICFGIVHAHACPRASLLLASSLSRLGPAGFQFPHGPLPAPGGVIATRTAY